MAPKLEVVDTSIDVVALMAAFRSRVPLMSMTPKVRVQPTIPLNSVSDAVTVKLLVSLPSELTVSEKVTCALEVVKVVVPVKVTAPVYVCVDVVVIEPSRSEVPEMVKLDVPAVLLMVPSRSKLANVCVACRSKVAPDETIKSVDGSSEPVNVRVPELTVVSPV